MVTVAVAGGTGHLGRTIVEALLATGKHDVKILSRTPNPTLSLTLGIPIIAVDYSDTPSLTKKLQELQIHTVISAMSNYDDAAGSHPKEVELIQAADASVATKRFVASRWSAPYSEKHIGQLSSVSNIGLARTALRSTTALEHTAFYSGFFLDYFGMPAVTSHMAPFTMVLDMAHNCAAVPGSGEREVVFTHTRDTARFVAASLELEKWESEMVVKG
ncbi:Oxidoreductase swnN, partial [Lachnellula suecica]